MDIYIYIYINLLFYFYLKKNVNTSNPIERVDKMDDEFFLYWYEKEV